MHNILIEPGTIAYLYDWNGGIYRTTAKLRLKKGAARGLDLVIEKVIQYNQSWPISVKWIDIGLGHDSFMGYNKRPIFDSNIILRMGIDPVIRRMVVYNSQEERDLFSQIEI